MYAVARERRKPPLGDFSYVMMCDERGSVLGSLLGIVICGGLGGLTAFGIVTLVGLSGTFGAIVAAAIGMVVATGLWAGGAWLLQRLRGTP